MFLNLRATVLENSHYHHPLNMFLLVLLYFAIFVVFLVPLNKGCSHCSTYNLHLQLEWWPEARLPWASARTPHITQQGVDSHIAHAPSWRPAYLVIKQKLFILF